MPATATTEKPRKPLLTILHEAIRWAASEGIPVSPDAAGVICTSRNPHRWERDPRAAACDPIGCLILMRQPPVSDLQRAEMLVLDAGPAFIAGMESGLTRETSSDAHYLKPATRRLYMAGLELGTWLRCELVAKACPKHGRFPADEPTCVACYEEDGAR